MTPAELGKAIYRGNCAFCHGLTAKGGRGPNLVSAPLTHGDSDAALTKTIHEGLPGSGMPAFGGQSKSELTALIGHIHSLAGTTVRKTVQVGDPKAGKQVYASNGCASCHRIGEQGSDYGPELTRIGSARPLEYLRESITNPDADIPERYEGVTLVTKDGQRGRGVKVNEDSFSIQIRDIQMRYHSFWKDDLKEISDSKKSLMPSYKTLSQPDLDNLVGYLQSLKSTASQGAAKQAEGIR